MIVDASHIPPACGGSYPVRSGNRVRPLIDGEPAFRRICGAVESATRSVWITVAFIRRDVQMPDGRGSFFDVIQAASERGLDVRVIFWRSPQQEAHEAGVHFSGTEEERAWLAERGASFRARWDYLPRQKCVHQKSWLLDAGTPGEVAFVGGINLLPDSVVPAGHPAREGGSTHDVYVEIEGPATSDVHHNFVQRWNEASERNRADGAWPRADPLDDLPFPERVSAETGDVPVQITRTIRKDQYRNGAACPGGAAFPIAGGEASVLEQYHAAIDAARDFIYVEDQAIGSLQMVERLAAALSRGVEVAYLVPGAGHPWLRQLRSVERFRPFFETVGKLGDHPNFLLAGIARNGGPDRYLDVFVHAKIALVDDGWATIGSTNVIDRSFYSDTEMNASFWHAPTARRFLRDLLEEHLEEDVSSLDGLAAIRRYARVARENAVRRARGEPQRGLVFALDPTTYGTDP